METNTFSNEADWYIDAVASVHWNSVHFAIYTIDGVAGFTNSHNDLAVSIKIDGNSLSILIPDNFRIESFHQCTDRNHRSPSAVNVWSSIAFDYIVVHNVFGGIDGHNDSAVSEWIFGTKGVFEGTIVSFVTSFDNNSDVSSGFLIRVNSQAALAVLYVMRALVVYVYRNLSIFVALISNPSIEGTFYLLNLTVFVNNRYGDLVVFIGWALYRIEIKALIGVGWNQSQSLGDELMLSGVVSNDFDFGAKERLVGCSVSRGAEETILWHWVNNSEAAVEAIGYIVSFNLDTIGINILSNYANSLAESDLIVNGHNLFIRVAPGPVVVSSVNIENSILSLAEFFSSEGYGSIVAIYTWKCNANFILTCSEVSLRSIANIFQGIRAITSWNKTQFICSQVRASCFTTNSDEVIFISFQRRGNNIFFAIKDFELNSIGEESVIVRPVAIGTSEDVATSLSSVDISWNSLISDYTDAVFYASLFVSDRNHDILLALHGKCSFEFTFNASINSVFSKFYNTRGGNTKFDILELSNGIIVLISNTAQSYSILTCITEFSSRSQIKSSHVVFVEFEIIIGVGCAISNVFGNSIYSEMIYCIFNVNIDGGSTFQRSLLGFFYSVANTSIERVRTFDIKAYLNFSVIANRGKCITILRTWFNFSGCAISIYQRNCTNISSLISFIINDPNFYII